MPTLIGLANNQPILQSKLPDQTVKCDVTAHVSFCFPNTSREPDLPVVRGRDAVTFSVSKYEAQKKASVSCFSGGVLRAPLHNTMLDVCVHGDQVAHPGAPVMSDSSRDDPYIASALLRAGVEPNPGPFFSLRLVALVLSVAYLYWMVRQSCQVDPTFHYYDGSINGSWTLPVDIKALFRTIQVWVMFQLYYFGGVLQILFDAFALSGREFVLYVQHFSWPIGSSRYLTDGWSFRELRFVVPWPGEWASELVADFLQFSDRALAWSLVQYDKISGYIYERADHCASRSWYNVYCWFAVARTNLLRAGIEPNPGPPRRGAAEPSLAPRCTECNKNGHVAANCWVTHPESRPLKGRKINTRQSAVAAAIVSSVARTAEEEAGAADPDPLEEPVAAPVTEPKPKFDELDERAISRPLHSRTLLRLPTRENDLVRLLTGLFQSWPAAYAVVVFIVSVLYLLLIRPCQRFFAESLVVYTRGLLIPLFWAYLALELPLVIATRLTVRVLPIASLLLVVCAGRRPRHIIISSLRHLDFDRYVDKRNIDSRRADLARVHPAPVELRLVEAADVGLPYFPVLIPLHRESVRVWAESIVQVLSMQLNFSPTSETLEVKLARVDAHLRRLLPVGVDRTDIDCMVATHLIIRLFIEDAHLRAPDFGQACSNSGQVVLWSSTASSQSKPVQMRPLTRAAIGPVPHRAYSPPVSSIGGISSMGLYGMAPLHMSSRDHTTLLQALGARSLTDPVAAESVTFRGGIHFTADQVWSSFSDYMDAEVAYIEPLSGDIPTHDQYMAIVASRHGHRRAQQYTEGAEKFAFDISILVKGNVVKAFGKDEFYFPSDLDAIDFSKALRMINAREDGAKALIGRIIHAIEKEILYTEEHVKGLTPQERVERFVEVLYVVGGTYFECDITSMEKSHTVQMNTTCAFKVYAAKMRGLPEAREFFAFCDEVLSGLNRIIVRDHWIALCLAVLMSGEVDTSMRNALVSKFVWRFAISATRNPKLLLLDDAGTQLRAALQPFGVFGLFEGDDSAVRCVSDDIEAIQSIMTVLGLEAKISIKQDLGSLGFCSQYFDIDEKVVLVDPFKACVKFSFLPGRYAGCGAKKLDALYRVKALSLLHLYAGCPIVSVLATRALELTSKVTNYQCIRALRALRAFDSHRFGELSLTVPAIKAISITSRLAFENLYHVTVPQQLIWEASIVNGGRWHKSPCGNAVLESQFEDYVRAKGATFYPYVFSNGYKLDDLARLNAGGTGHLPTKQMRRRFDALRSGNVEKQPGPLWLATTLICQWVCLFTVQNGGCLPEANRSKAYAGCSRDCTDWSASFQTHEQSLLTWNPLMSDLHVQLSGCAEEYLQGLLDPCNATPPCLPALIGPPSLKFKVSAKGSGSTGQQGVGFIVVSPGLCIVKDWQVQFLPEAKEKPRPRVGHSLSATAAARAAAAASSALPSSAVRRASGAPTQTAPLDGSIWVSTAAFGSQIPQDGIADFTYITNNPGEVARYVTNTPYSATQFMEASENSLQYRVVSGCISVSSETTTFQTGGRVTGLCDPQHAGLTGVDVETMRANRSATHRRFDDRKFEVCWTGPVQASEMSYTSAMGMAQMLNLDPIDGDPTKVNWNNPCMGIIVQAATSGGSAQEIPFDWEVTFNYEVIGPAAGIGSVAGYGASPGAFSLTPSGVDPQGAGMVIEAVQTARVEAGEEVPDGTPAFKKRVRATLLGLARKVMTFIVPKAAAAAASVIAPGTGGMAARAAAAAIKPLERKAKKEERRLKDRARAIEGKSPKKPNAKQ